MFNLDSLALKTDSVFVQLKHPDSDVELVDDKGQKIGVYVYGTASEQYRNAVNALQRRALARGKKAATPEQLKEEGVELLVAVSDRGENIEFNGKPLDNPAAFRALYKDARFSWVKDQVDEAVGEKANFLAQPATA